MVASRRVLRDLPEAARTRRSDQLAALPASRLSGGRARSDLTALLADGGALWIGVRAALERDAPDVLELVDDGPPTTASPPTTAPSPSSGPGADVRRATDDLRSRLRGLRSERDGLQRRLDGAEARADAAERARHDMEDRLVAAEARAAALEQDLAEEEGRRRQAVERERRRRASEEQAVADELRDVRRQLDEARREIAQLREQAAAPVAPAPPEAPVEDTHGLRHGRPSRLPDDVARPSREAAELLVQGSRLVLVDGWNVTRTHRGHMDWAQQRRWLVEATGAMCLRQQVDVTVVFDAGASGSSSGSTTRHGRVLVAYAPAHVTADDDLVFRVSAADTGQPITVVTDDRELRGRLLEHGVDLLATVEWVWLLQ